MEENMTTININTNIAAASASPATSTSSPAFESTLTSYASRILRIKSPSTASIDASVGPYVTSVLRSALGDCDASSASVEDSDFLESSIPEEYDALMELMMEQCEMQREGASSALHCIAKAIQTGQFEDLPLFSFDVSGNQQLPRRRNIHVGAGSNLTHRRGTMVGNGIGMGIGGGMGNGFSTGMGMGGYRSKFRSKSMGAEHDYGEEETINFLGEMLQRSGTTLPSWSVGIQHDDSDSPGNSYVGRGAAGGVIIEEDEDPSFHFEEDEAPIKSTPIKDNGGRVESPSPLTSMHLSNDSNKTPRPGTNIKGGNFMLEGFSPFWTAEEKRVVEELKNLPAPNFSFTPLKPDRLIPVDLLGVIDDPVTPANDLKSVVGMNGNDKKMGIRTRTIAPVSEERGADSNAGNVLSPSVKEKSPSLPTLMSISKVKKTSPLNGNEDSVENMIGRNVISSPLASSHVSKVTTTPIDLPQAQVLMSTRLSSGKGKKNKKKKDNDLAAALFTRPRARSMQCYHEEKSPKLKPMAPPPVSQIGMSNLSCSAAAVMNNSIPALFQKQLDSAVEILLAMNYDVCRDAAYEAALVSNADVNIAQHVIDGALAAPPVCRHMLNDGCYRSDCHFSHDVDGHTCLFWLRGRCGKGDSGCRFMHGFSEKLLDGVDLDARKRTPNKESRSSSAGAFFLSPSQTSSNTSASKPIPVRTANLVQHNMKTSFSLSSSFERKTFLDSSASVSETHLINFLSGVSRASPDQSRNGSKLSAQTEKHDVTDGISFAPALTPTQMQQKRNIPTPTFSFASIASKGYSQKKSFNNSATKSGNLNKLLNDTSNEKKTVRIPQSLWTSTHHRSSTAFHISDPLARFREVNSSQKDDVLDLHFQSVKTFPLVLANILPEKLRRNGQVWVITGSGHHVHRGSHQKTGGVLETAVIGWLVSNEYNFLKGKDKNGYGGAVLVQTSR
uniref:C3H1-type domain-containing protein n=1 Tax=Chaetoceros debilis TaxID=122233 RepID=A0A7S3V5R5_9STRA